jgi:hypothetical protein
MKFALFMLSEYIGMIAISAIVVSLYFGGYQDGFGIVNFIPILGPVVLIGKIILFLILMIWIRSTLPRFRYDRLMAFGWKVMLPLALIAVSGTALAVLIGDLTDSVVVYAIAAGIFFVLLMVGAAIMFGRGERSVLAERQDDWSDDPLVTGERGLGWNLTQVLGGLLALPFLLFDWTLKILDGLASLGREKPANDAAAPGRSDTE